MPEREAIHIAEAGDRAVVRLKSCVPTGPSLSLADPGLGEDVRLLNLGPGEWLAVSDVREGPKLREDLQRQLLGEGIVAADLSCGIKALKVEGAAVRELLAKGCGLDLHPRSFPAGRCTRTRLAQLAVVVDCTDAKPSFHLYVGRSYVRYLHAWLLDAAVEFGGTSTAERG